jgi:hypothetical protein
MYGLTRTTAISGHTHLVAGTRRTKKFTCRGRWKDFEAWKTVMRPWSGATTGSAPPSFQDLDIVFGEKCLDGRAIVVGHAVRFNAIVGKSSGPEGQQEPPLVRPDVAEGMGDVPRCHDHRARRHRHLLAADGPLELPFQDIADLRLVAMDVRRRPLAGRDCCSTMA